MRNPRRLIFSLASVLVVFVPALVRAEPGVRNLIESDFGRKGEGSLPRLTEEKDRDKQPFKHPTSLSVVPPSTLEMKKEGVEGYAEPAIVYNIGLLPAGREEAAAAARVEWVFTKAKLPMNGVYEVQYTLIPLKLPIRGGGRVLFTLLDPKMQRLADANGPPTLAFSGDQYGAGSNSLKVKEGQPFAVKLRLDLNKHLFDAWVEGKPVIKQEPLSVAITNGYPEVFLGSLVLGSEAGTGDKSGGSYAMGGLKMTWLKESPSSE